MLVKKQTQSRNLLHFEVFKEWNRLTENEESKRDFFNKEHIAKIKNGNCLFTDEYVKQLNPKGATMLWLECIYTSKNQGDEKLKIYSKEWGSEGMMKAVMETISYHFKPKMFYKFETGPDGKKYYTDVFDVEKIIKLVPKVYKETMYRRFGILGKEVALGIKDRSLIEDYEETTEDVDEETGEVFESHYFVTNPLNVYHKSENNKIVLKRHAENRIHVLRAKSGREAVQQLNGMIEKNKYK